MDESTKRLISLGKCVKCKGMRMQSTVVCTGCSEYKYCSKECLEADKENHVLDCHAIRMQKTFSVADVSEEDGSLKTNNRESQAGIGEKTGQKKSKKKKKKNKAALENIQGASSGDVDESSPQKGFGSCYGDIDDYNEADSAGASAPNLFSRKGYKESDGNMNASGEVSAVAVHSGEKKSFKDFYGDIDDDDNEYSGGTGSPSKSFFKKDFKDIYGDIEVDADVDDIPKPSGKKTFKDFYGDIDDEEDMTSSKSKGSKHKSGKAAGKSGKKSTFSKGFLNSNSNGIDSIDQGASRGNGNAKNQPTTQPQSIVRDSLPPQPISHTQSNAKDSLPKPQTNLQPPGPLSEIDGKVFMSLVDFGAQSAALNAAKVDAFINSKDKDKKDDGKVKAKDKSAPKPKNCFHCGKESLNLKACSRCEMTYYCGRDCQIQDYKQHKMACRLFESVVSGTKEREAKVKDAKSKKTEVEMFTCFFCMKKSKSLLMCSRCQIVRYCDKECQIKDFKHHKTFCRRTVRFREAKEKVNPGIMRELKSRDMELIADFDGVRDEFEAGYMGYDTAILAEIMEPWFHPFRVGIHIQDENGKTAPLIFYTDTLDYPFQLQTKTGKQQVSIPLTTCCEPGNFIIIMAPEWHAFADGTCGFRINNINLVAFVMP